MNQIESILEFLLSCDLRLWSDSAHKINTEGIKHLARLVVEQLDLELLRIDAYYYQEWRNWVIVFRWHASDGQLNGLDYRIDASHLEGMRQMVELGQIEIPRSGYFDGILMDYSGQPRDRDRIEIPRQQMPSIEARFTEPSGVPLQELRGHLEVVRQEIMSPIPKAINAIGDVSCEYNAKSKYLRCTVNPCGPCEGCQHYETG